MAMRTGMEGYGRRENWKKARSGALGFGVARVLVRRELAE